MKRAFITCIKKYQPAYIQLNELKIRIRTWISFVIRFAGMLEEFRPRN